MVTKGDETRTSIASAIDLAGSEDNRRTDNGKERLVESASINKSLFVLAQCVEAISKKQARIPYRESKMTRILSLGQNNGLTIMILNLAPVRSYHLDTLSSLNFANRTKKIEIREVENEPVFKGCSREVVLPSVIGASIQRQPLRPLAAATHNSLARPADHAKISDGKPPKAFSVYSDLPKRHSAHTDHMLQPGMPRRSSPLKRSLDLPNANTLRPAKLARPSPCTRPKSQPAITKAAIEDIIEKKVTEILAARAMDQQPTAPVTIISEEVQRRLDLLEQKIEGKDDTRAEGLNFLLMAKQHHVRGEEASALRMYELAWNHFPDNTKLESKIAKLRARLQQKMHLETEKGLESTPMHSLHNLSQPKSTWAHADEEYGEPGESEDSEYQSDDGFRFKSKPNKLRRVKVFSLVSLDEDGVQTPRTKQLLSIINTRDVGQIRLLKGVGEKKANAIVAALWAGEVDDDVKDRSISSLSQLGRLKGVGSRTVDNMRLGLDGTRL